MRRYVCVAVVSMLVSAGACGGTKEEKRAEEARKQAERAQKTTEKAAESAASGLAQMAKGLEQMAAGAAGAADTKPVDPVGFRDLETFFPDVPGWTKEKPTGERMSSPFAYSQAQVRYTRDTSSIELKIVDSGFNQLLLTPYAMFLQSGYEKETSDGYEKSTPVNNQPGWEKWNDSSKDGELNALVGKRFLMTIEGSRISGTKVLHEVAGRIDMNKLAALKAK